MKKLLMFGLCFAAVSVQASGEQLLGQIAGFTRITLITGCAAVGGVKLLQMIYQQVTGDVSMAEMIKKLEADRSCGDRGEVMNDPFLTRSEIVQGVTFTLSRHAGCGAMEYSEITLKQALAFIRRNKKLKLDQFGMKPAVTVSVPGGRDKESVLDYLFNQAGVERLTQRG